MLKLSQKTILCLGLLLCSSAFSDPTYYFTPVASLSQLKIVSGKPAIVLLVKDIDHQKMKPFMFVLESTNNYVMFNMNARTYQVISATLQTNHGDIKDFCHLQNGPKTNKALMLHLRGHLTDNPKDLECRAQYQAQS